MAPRLQLQSLFETLLGSRNVYFQPPANIQMQYPCIIYERDAANSKFADDIPYHTTKRYQVTVVDRDPDSSIPDRVAALPLCSYSRFFTADDLNHDVFNLFF